MDAACVPQVWSCVSWFGARPLLPAKGSLNATAVWGRPFFLFQRDKASIHKERPLKRQFSDLCVRELGRPEQSPVLNPIEHLWDELELRLWARPYQPTSVLLLWCLNGSKCLQPGSKIFLKAFPEEWRQLLRQINVRFGIIVGASCCNVWVSTYIWSSRSNFNIGCNCANWNCTFEGDIF